jgi:hypothetical protein
VKLKLFSYIAFRTLGLSLSSLSLSLGGFALASETVTKKVERVIPGDKFSKIIGRLIAGPVWGKNGSFAQVIKLNPQIKNPDLIYPGDVIFLPNGESFTMGPQAKRSFRKLASAAKPAQTTDAPDEIVPETQASPVASIATSPQVCANEIPAKKESPDVSQLDKTSDDQSSDSFQIAPSLSMTTISSTDVYTGARDAVASEEYATVDARYVQYWNEDFQTRLGGKLSYINFAQPATGTQSLSGGSKFLTSFGLGFSEALSSRLSVGGSFDVAQNLFLRAATSNSVTIDSLLLPVFGANISYDLIKRNAFVIGLGLNYSELMKGSTASYNVGLGSQYGGTIQFRSRKNHEDHFAVELGAQQRNQNTSVTTQTDTTYTLSFRLFFPNSEKSGGAK